MILDPSNQLDWDSEVNDFSALDAYLANQEFTIPLDTLTQDVPAGLGFSSNCKEWLTLLDINTWDDLVFHSFQFSIDRLMLHLTVPVYFEYRTDLRRFLIFGLLCNPNSSHSLPTRRTLKNWIPHYVLLLRAHLQKFTTQEKQAVSTLHIQNSVSSSQKPSFDHPNRGPFPSTSVPTPLPNLSVTVPGVHSNGGIFQDQVLNLWSLTSLSIFQIPLPSFW